MADIFTVHLAAVGPLQVARSLVRSVGEGPVHLEAMMPMTLGTPILDPRRYHARELCIFARWRDEAAIDEFLGSSATGRVLAEGWHVRLKFTRRWGSVSGLEDLPTRNGDTDPDEPTVAVTLARLKLRESARFIRWGKPVERQVRDHAGVRLALAATRPHHTLSTFTIWDRERDMTDMVQEPGSHSSAMTERARKDFHHEFTTLRFRPLGEHGTWKGRSGIAA